MHPEGKVVAVCRSGKKGVPKEPIDQGHLKVDWGLEGDAHAGKWHRQISLLADESIAKMRAKGLDVGPGSFAENVTTQGLCLHTLPVGTLLELGSALVRITQIGKTCHSRCAIYQQTGDCVMPREGVFAEVLEPGKVRAGERCRVVDDYIK